MMKEIFTRGKSQPVGIDPTVNGSSTLCRRHMFVFPVAKLCWLFIHGLVFSPWAPLYLLPSSASFSFFISRRLLFERLLRYLVEIPESISFQLIPGHWQRAPLPAPVHVSRAPSLYIFIDIRTEWALLLLPNTHEKNKSINTKPAAAGFWFTV